MKKPKVLFVNIRNKDKIVAEHPEIDVHALPDYYYSYVEGQELDVSFFDNYFRFTVAYIKEHNIDGIVCRNDIGALVAASLCARTGLRGPDEVSVLLASNKFLMRRHLKREGETATLLNHKTKVKDEHFPFFVKAPYSAFGLFAQTIHSREDLKSYFKNYWGKIKGHNKNLFSLIQFNEAHVDYQESTRNMVSAELLRVEKQQVTVEGFVQNGITECYAVVDSHLEASSGAFESFTMPSAVSDALRKRLYAESARIISSLGINESCFNIEFWYDLDGSINLIEVNPRMSYSFKRLYQKALGINPMSIAIDIALGKEVSLLVSDPKDLGEYSGLFNLRADRVGEAGELFDLRKARANPSVLIRTPRNRLLTLQGHHGDIFADVIVQGNSLDELKKKAQTILNSLRKPDSNLKG